jgi:hypothetical protein
MKHICIIGGGISGLTTAFELIEQNYKVTIIERNDIVGGLARTYQNSEKKICPYEYSWRAYGRWYQNVYDIMKRIPFSKSENVYDKLVILQGGEKTCNKKMNNYNNKLDLLSLPLIIKFQIIKYFCSCDERNREYFSKIGLREFIINNKISKDIENSIGKIVGPYLGFDYQNASLYDLLYYVEMLKNNESDEYNFNITSLPTSYIWFDPWIKLLKEKNVTILLNTEVKEIIYDNTNNIIINISILDKINNIYKTINADYYINCTGPEILEKLLKPLNLFNKIKELHYNISKVVENGKQIQLSIYYYIDKKIYLEKKNTLAYLPNTPWLLMVLPTGHIWGDDYLSKYCIKDIKEVISIGICEPYVNGLLIKKPWSECTRDEIKLETWYQLINDLDFINNICIENNEKIENIKIIQFTMWDSFIFKNGKINTYEPKWANNINTIQYRPKPNTNIYNLFIAGSYTDTTTGTFSMESAVESGKKVAKLICKIDNKTENIYLHTKKKYLITYPIRYIDSLIYNGYKKKYILIIIIIICLYFLMKKHKSMI